MGSNTAIRSSIQSIAQANEEDRIKIAVEYQTAILLILSLPQIVEEQILRERIRFQEIDWEKRIAYYDQLLMDTIEPIIPNPPVDATGEAFFGCVNQKLSL